MEVVEVVEVVEGKRVGPIALVPPEQADTVMATRMTALLNTAAPLEWRRAPISFRTDTPSSSVIGTEAFADIYETRRETARSRRQRPRHRDRSDQRILCGERTPLVTVSQHTRGAEGTETFVVTICPDDPLMTDYSPFSGSNPQASRLELVRTLWTMTKLGKKPITAAIYQTAYGRELRVHVGADADNLIDSLLSRIDDAPLEFKADKLRAVLLDQGWS